MDRPYPDGIAFDEAWHQRQRAESMAKSVAHFLYWSGWLENRHASAALFVHDMGEPSFQIGTKTFERLEASLDDAYPEWRDWNPNYSSH